MESQTYEIKPTSSVPLRHHNNVIKLHSIDPNDFLRIQSTIKSLISQIQTQKPKQQYIDTSSLSKQSLPIFLKTLFKYTYKFTKYKSISPQPIQIFITDKTQSRITLLFKWKKCYEIALELANEPANKITPLSFAQRTKRLFTNLPQTSSPPPKITILNSTELKKQGFGLILAVGQGTSKAHQPALLVIDLPPTQTTAKTQPICIVGKGVIFDSGSYELKPYEYMKGMHTDKTGAALTVAIMHHLASHHVQRTRRVIAIIPLVENVIGPSATKPNDIVTAYNKRTVEIRSNDAEGRLIMADAFAYATVKYNPEIMIDFATLTGWANQLHCDTSAIFYSESEALTKLVYKHGNNNGERFIRMPPWPEYATYIKSNVADYKNGDFNSCKKSGGFMAAMFLSAFLPTQLRKKWIHFDVTHTDSIEGLESNCNTFATATDLIGSLI